MWARRPRTSRRSNRGTPRRRTSRLPRCGSSAVFRRWRRIRSMRPRNGRSWWWSLPCIRGRSWWSDGETREMRRCSRNPLFRRQGRCRCRRGGPNASARPRCSGHMPRSRWLRLGVWRSRLVEQGAFRGSWRRHLLVDLCFECALQRRKISLAFVLLAPACCNLRRAEVQNRRETKRRTSVRRADATEGVACEERRIKHNIDALGADADDGALGRKGNGAEVEHIDHAVAELKRCLLYTSPSPRDRTRSRMPSSA